MTTETGAGERQADWVELLARTPLFAALAPEDRAEAARHLVERTFRRGETVCNAGDVGDTLFVCTSGQLDVWGGAPRRVINRLGPGDCFGELSLLLGDRRAATVTAARTTTVLVLDREGFERFFLGNPKALAYLTKILGQRLAAMARGETAPRCGTVVAVVGEEGVRGKSFVAATLATLLATMTRTEAIVVRLRPREGRDDLPTLRDLVQQPTEGLATRVDRGEAGVAMLGVPVGGWDGARPELLAALVDRLDTTFPFVVLDLDGALEGLRGAVEDVADAVVELVTRCEGAPPGGAVPRFRVLNLHDPRALPVAIADCDPFVLREDRALHGLGPAAQAARVLAEPRSPTAPALHRLARKILGTTVGLVLGGGAAFGLAHLGVLKVLEDEGIPVDLVVGCSMGSIVALGYAGGYRPREMIDIAMRLGTVRNTIWAASDLTLSRPALLSGDRLMALFRPLYAHYQRFDQLQFPCRVVATDIETGERVALGHGDIESAGRASASVPMLWPPVRRDGRILVDGGVADPVPAEVARAMGADVCLTVNAVPQLRRGVETVLTRAYRRLKLLDPLSHLAGTQGMPNMIDLVMSTMQTLQHELGDFKAISADVRMNPDLSDLTWIEFYRPQDFIERGVRAAERAIPQIHRVLAERLERAITSSLNTSARAVESRS